MFISVDTVQGSKNLSPEAATTRGCVLNSRFPRNGDIVFRARVFDPRTGDLMDDKALSNVQVNLATGANVKMHFGAHPPKSAPQEFYWTVSWPIPKDQATGTLKYTVAATSADGRSGTFEPMIVATALPTILDEVLPDISA